MNWVYKNRIGILAAIVGAAIGFAYYYFIGCKNGNCAIASNPYISTVYGSILCILLLNNFKKYPKKSTVNEK